jgi:hypothetical protein
MCALCCYFVISKNGHLQRLHLKCNSVSWCRALAFVSVQCRCLGASSVFRLRSLGAALRLRSTAGFQRAKASYINKARVFVSDGCFSGSCCTAHHITDVYWSRECNIATLACRNNHSVRRSWTVNCRGKPQPTFPPSCDSCASVQHRGGSVGKGCGWVKQCRRAWSGCSQDLGLGHST